MGPFLAGALALHPSFVGHRLEADLASVLHSCARLHIVGCGFISYFGGKGYGEIIMMLG